MEEIPDSFLQEFEEQRQWQEEAGDGVTGISMAFPKNPPPPGITYSRNFARFQKDGIFANQQRD